MLFHLPDCDKMQVQRTEQLLKSIAWHLSSKRKCKGAIYEVIIQDSYDAPEDICSVCCNQEVQLRSHLNRNYMCSVVEHILTHHFEELQNYTDQALAQKCLVRKNLFLPGKYEYQISASGKYRRWCRV